MYLHPRDRTCSLGVSGSPPVMADSQRKFSLDALAPGFTRVRTVSDGAISLEEELARLEESNFKGMAKLHYVDKKDRVACLGCNRKFTIKLRPRHCRRCGEVFCLKCVQQKTRLNKLACPDPSGKERKVCSACYAASRLEPGCTRSLTESFLHERTMARHEHVLHQRVNSLTTTFWRDQLDINAECRRLLTGFEHAVGNSESRRTLQEVRNLVDTPTWQQSPYWKLESGSTHCRACKRSLGVRKQRRNCRVCGLALCKRCSNHELLVYYPEPTTADTGVGAEGRRMGSVTGADNSGNNGNMMANRPAARLVIIKQPGAPPKEPIVSLLLKGVSADTGAGAKGRRMGSPAGADKSRTNGIKTNRPAPRLAVIKQPGAPPKEPTVSLLLHVCSDCKCYIAARQTSSPEWGSSQDSVGPVEAVVSMDSHIQDLQSLIGEAISQIQLGQDAVDGGKIPTKSSDRNKNRNYIVEVETYLRQYNVEFQKLKTLLPLSQSNTQTLLIRNYIKGRHEYFMESKQLVAQLRRHGPVDNGLQRRT